MIVLLIVLLSQILLFINTLFFLMTGYETSKMTEWVLYKILRVQTYSDQQSCDLDPKAQMILCNHRSFADFFLDSLFIGDVTHLSRMMVMFALPFSALYGIVTGRVLFFKRNGRNRKSLSELIDQHFNFRSTPMIIYPEGHRNTNSTSLPLKVGILKIAYEQSRSVQCALTSQKEFILNEKKLTAGFHIKAVTTRSALIDPKNYENFEDFLKEVRLQWDKTWSRLQSVPLEETKPYTPKIQGRWQALKPWIDRPLLIAMFCIVFFCG